MYAWMNRPTCATKKKMMKIILAHPHKKQKEIRRQDNDDPFDDDWKRLQMTRESTFCV